MNLTNTLKVKIYLNVEKLSVAVFPPEIHLNVKDTYLSIDTISVLPKSMQKTVHIGLLTFFRSMLLMRHRCHMLSVSLNIRYNLPVTIRITCKVRSLVEMNGDKAEE